MAEPKPLYRAGDMLQIAATIAGITLALATFYNDRANGNPDMSSIIITTLLLLAGFCALYGSGCAMAELYLEHVEQGKKAPDSLHWISGSLFLTGCVYATILVNLFR